MPVQKEDQHYEVSMAVNGNEKVAFVTDLGWATHASTNIDACNIQDAVAIVTKYLDGLELVPAFNDCTNEEYVEHAQYCIDSIKNTIATVEDSVKGYDEGDTVHVSISSTIDIYIGFTKTYVVNFGEESEA